MKISPFFRAIVRIASSKKFLSKVWYGDNKKGLHQSLAIFPNLEFALILLEKAGAEKILPGLQQAEKMAKEISNIIEDIVWCYQNDKEKFEDYYIQFIEEDEEGDDDEDYLDSQEIGKYEMRILVERLKAADTLEEFRESVKEAWLGSKRSASIIRKMEGEIPELESIEAYLEEVMRLLEEVED